MNTPADDVLIELLTRGIEAVPTQHADMAQRLSALEMLVVRLANEVDYLRSLADPS